MKSIDLFGCGNSIVDQQFSVTEEVIRKTGLVLDQMTLATPQDHERILAILDQHQCQSIASCGGSATNTIIAAAYFGSRCHHVCYVADDSEGRTFLQSLKQADVSTSTGISSDSLPTGRCLVLVTPDGKRTMSTCLGVSASFDVARLDFSDVQHSKMVYIEGYMATSVQNAQTVVSVLEEATKQSCQKALSLSDPWVAATFKETIDQWIQYGIDILFCNDAEAMAFTQTSDLEQAQSILKTLTKQYVITCGAKGALLYDGKHCLKVPGQSVSVVDTNGAGDMFAGAFLHAILKGDDVKSAGIFANKAAARIVQHFGARLEKEQYMALV